MIRRLICCFEKNDVKAFCDLVLQPFELPITSEKHSDNLIRVQCANATIERVW